MNSTDRKSSVTFINPPLTAKISGHLLASSGIDVVFIQEPDCAVDAFVQFPYSGTFFPDAVKNISDTTGFQFGPLDVLTEFSLCIGAERYLVNCTDGPGGMLLMLSSMITDSSDSLVQWLREQIESAAKISNVSELPPAGGSSGLEQSIINLIPEHESRLRNGLSILSAIVHGKSYAGLTESGFQSMLHGAVTGWHYPVNISGYSPGESDNVEIITDTRITEITRISNDNTRHEVKFENGNSIRGDILVYPMGDRFDDPSRRGIPGLIPWYSWRCESGSEISPGAGAIIQDPQRPPCNDNFVTYLSTGKTLRAAVPLEDRYLLPENIDRLKNILTASNKSVSTHLQVEIRPVYPDHVSDKPQITLPGTINRLPVPGTVNWGDGLVSTWHQAEDIRSGIIGLM